MLKLRSSDSTVQTQVSIEGKFVSSAEKNCSCVNCYAINNNDSYILCLSEGF